MDYLTAAQKAFCAEALSNVFDTFQETIVAYKNCERVVISEPGPDFNFLYKDANTTNQQVQYIPVSGSFAATVEYLASLPQQPLEKSLQGGFGNLDPNTADLKTEAPKNIVRICVRQDGNDFLKDCKILKIDNMEFERFSASMPRGIFDRDNFNFWFKRIE